MTNLASDHNTTTPEGRASVKTRANRLADRLEQGARALAALAAGLTEAEWQTPLPGDGRKIGVIVDHVASVYPVEIQLAQTLAAGQRVTGVTMDDVHAMNAAHAAENATVTKEAHQRGRRRSHQESERRGARLRRRGIAVLQCPDHVSVHARGSRRPAQLSSSRADQKNIADLDITCGFRL
jgi:hypothetical protein